MNIFEWGHVPLGVYVFICIAGIIMFVLIFHGEDLFENERIQKIYAWLYKCVIKCGKKCHANNFHGAGYFMKAKHFNRCSVTRWEITHIFTHIILGFFTNIYISQTISVGFELYEKYIFNGGSWLDLGYNFGGFMIGHKLKNAWNKKREPLNLEEIM